MDKLSPPLGGMVDPNDLPEGFTAVDPNNANNPSAQQAAEAENFKKQAIQEQKQMILEQAMDNEALARLGRIKLVKPEKATQVENTIISMAMQNKLPGRISEAKLIEILERSNRQGAAQAHASSSINIQRKSYALDSDDDEDDDDDDDDV
ncbi:double-stranded DNA-binding domain containing protein [Nitzschia inconspicua]|uniref:Double-stranded DNA-binding domain containing protein n=1 Tax=Nitzschia inconspicua TaxID=303405 RepID=A0A9K3KHA8_9STRA|nr:double-stranded DNA-binding domain containing protein [Nitzschia inconspicua]